MKKSHFNRLATLVFGALLGGGYVGAGASVTGSQTQANWIGPTGMGGDGEWSTAADWSGGVVPNNGNGITYAVTLPTYSSIYSVGLDINATIDSLALANNTELFITNRFDLTTNSLTSNGAVAVIFDSNLDVKGSLANSGSGFPFFFDVGQGSMVNVGRDFNNTGLISNAGVITAANYVQNGNNASMDLGGIMNVADATVNSGFFRIFGGGSLHGNLEARGTVVDLQRATIDGNVQMNGGLLEPRTVHGFVTVVGNLTTTSSSTYSPEIFHNNIPVTVFGDATLAGTADLHFCCGGFHNGERLDIMTYQAETGQFSTVELFGLLRGQTATLEYGPTDLEAVIVGNGIIPEPASLLLMGTGILTLAYCARHRFGF